MTSKRFVVELRLDDAEIAEDGPFGVARALRRLADRLDAVGDGFGTLDDGPFPVIDTNGNLIGEGCTVT